ncbi:MAG TPA: hypothetical protein VFH56_04870 [Acidimicrobiales bacterium]|nr:hypothetical protein [Acidimicrobiales bacterium]
MQTVAIPPFEVTLAAGDQIGLQVYVAGATVSTATFSANDGAGSFLRLRKLP